jgi:DNA replication regulator SLD2
MEVQEREELTERSNTLRVELKIWEKNFAAANNGKKASRDDIKKHPDIGKISELPMLKSLLLKPS